ncbi:P-loop containing nucleoside triphosphate hydrolase protein [Atractiella rhizophila]|nr:P-loop containing nucleoside triphosphate hydrolase protein [Atractiella rhizophila]
MDFPNDHQSVEPTWPQRGRIAFEHVDVRYNNEANLALDDINFEIQGGTRLGVCGRTGSGKTTLINSLFRLREIESGKIKIDGIDIAAISRLALRSRLTIIPQDPVLLATSLRDNLDIANCWSDDDIWKALESVHVRPFRCPITTTSSHVEGLPAKLDTTIKNDGDTFSRGQRQLLCLARAMLSRNKKIVAIDEGTSSIDQLTENALQEALRDAFRSCTVLIVAHRIHTIENSSDMIAVLDGGRLVEYDAPQELVKNEGGYFYKLAREEKENDTDLIDLD